jgi:hypothetical protein
MYRIVLWVAIVTLLAMTALGGAIVLFVPQMRHGISAMWNLPDFLPAYSGNAHLRYEPGAEDFARAVAELLPDAIARIEAVHGRGFKKPTIIAVYLTKEAYAAANGLGSAVPVGVTTLGRVHLSPDLFGSQRHRLRAIVTHELSHAHLVGWLGKIAYFRLPNWFVEGLAVMVSDGGGAEFVGEDEARMALKRGERIVVNEVKILGDGHAIHLEQMPTGRSPLSRFHLAYRQSGMFVAYLRDSDRSAFDQVMLTILNGGPLGDAIKAGYNEDLQSLWRKFLVANDSRPLAH